MNKEYSKIYNININNKNDYVKDNIENKIIDFNKVKNIFNKISNINDKNFKYLIPSYFIQTNAKNEDIYTTKNLNKIIIDNITYNILKNKFIMWPKNDLIFMTYQFFYKIFNL